MSQRTTMEQLHRLIASAERPDLEAVLEMLGVRDYDRAFIAGELRWREVAARSRRAARIAAREQEARR